MTLQDLGPLPGHFNNYAQAAPQLSVTAALHSSLESITQKLEEKLNAIRDEVYEPGKWRVPVILQHLIDTERIMSYRALCFARGEQTSLPGFDENEYASHTLNTIRTVSELLEELKLVRVSSIFLFDSFDDDTLKKTGTANNMIVPVGGLAYVIAGHQAHHFKVIEERYQPLAKGLVSPF